MHSNSRSGNQRLLTRQEALELLLLLERWIPDRTKLEQFLNQAAPLIRSPRRFLNSLRKAAARLAGPPTWM